MTSRAAHYREEAFACERRAEEVRDPYVKLTFLNLANQWRDLAGQVENLEKNRWSWSDLNRKDHDR